MKGSLRLRRRVPAEPEVPGLDLLAPTEANPAAADVPEGPVQSPGVRQAQWTGGSRLATGAASLLLWSALLTGPAALALTVLGSGASTGPRPAAAGRVVDRSGQQAAAGEFAEQLVVTWLRTPQGQENRLRPYLQMPVVTLPQHPWAVSEPAVAGIRRTAGGTWSVLVGVTVAPQPRAAGVRRYFQVPVLTGPAGGLLAAALPAPVAGPPAAAPVQLAYRYDVDLSDPAAGTAQEFLSALLTGSSDITRFVSPGSTVPAVLPPLCRTVRLVSVLADRDVTGLATPLPTGQLLRVEVTADATAGPQQSISVQYALTLAARAGRWEIRSVDPAPAPGRTTGPPGSTGSTGPAPSSTPSSPPGTPPGE